MSKYQDFCMKNASRLFEIIQEHGSLLKWRKEWTGQGTTSLPLSSNGLYKGGNLFSLLYMQQKNGFKSNQWLTFKQVQKLKGQVLKGSKSEEVCFWSLIDVAEVNPKTNQSEVQKRPIFKTYRVFNLEQTTLFDGEPVTFDSHMSSDLLIALNPDISHFGSHAYYNPESDVIVLPKPEQFTNHDAYEATLLHELTHWTGHKSRLNRDCMANYSNQKDRAEEELTAEIGAFFLATYFNIQSDIENHASYVSSWKKLLNEKDVMRATNRAAKAFHFMIERLEVDQVKNAA